MMKTRTRKWTSERISQAVLYVIVGLTAVVFALFRLVGYDIPYFDNPELNAPLLTGVLIAFMILLTVVAVAIALIAACRSLKKNRRAAKVVDGIHAARLARLRGCGNRGACPHLRPRKHAACGSQWGRLRRQFLVACRRYVRQFVAVAHRCRRRRSGVRSHTERKKT